MLTHAQPPRYHACILRMWEERVHDAEDEEQAEGEGGDEGAGWTEMPISVKGEWRFQVEEAHTGRRLGFVDLSGLLTYLHEVMSREGIVQADSAETTQQRRRTTDDGVQRRSP